VTETIKIPARKGKAEFVKSGQHIKVINTLGAQAVDTWAFSMYDQREFMSMVHTRSTLTKMMAGAGEHLYTNSRRPILTLVEDTSPGIHDTLDVRLRCASIRLVRLCGISRQLHR